MGSYLSRPVTDEVSVDVENERTACGASSLQGPRETQEDILYIDMAAPVELKKEQNISSNKPNNNWDTDPIETRSEHNEVVTSHNLCRPEKNDYASVFPKMMKNMKKKEKTGHKVVNQEKKIIPDNANKIIKKTMSDNSVEKIVQNKTVVRSEGKYNSEIGTFDFSNTYTKNFSSSKKQKMNDEKQRVINGGSQANDSINILNLDEERTLLPLETEKKKKKQKNVKDILNDVTVAPNEQLKLCHKINDHFDSNQNVCSETNGVVPHNSNITEDDAHLLSLSKTMKLKKKMKKNDHKVENQEQKEILERATENQQTIINDAIPNKKVQTKTIGSNKEKCKEEQKLRTLVRRKGMYVCTVGNTTFKRSSSLSLHQLCHKDSVKCKDCSMTFTKQSLLLQHSRLHTMKQTLECEDCNKTFSSKSHLIRHNRKHSGERPYACDVCGQRFKCSYHLTRHNKIHTGERPYACDVCGKSFFQAMNMKVHYRVHTGERPYACDICGQRFKCSYNLTRHNKIHTGERPYTCNVCGKLFTRKLNLIPHYRIHTGEKPFNCELCEKSFTQSQNLKEHIQRKHYKCL